MGLFDFVQNFIAAPIASAITGVPASVVQNIPLPRSNSFAVADVALNFIPGGSTIQGIVNTAPTPSREV